MEYLYRVLGYETVYQDEILKSMPSYICSRYRLRKVTIDGNQAIFVYPKNELDSVNHIRKHIERIEREVNAPAVLVLDRLTYRQKEYLLRDRIPFVVDGKQIYLPFMAVYLQERSDSERIKVKSLLPSAQLLLLHFIYEGCKGMLASDACKALSLTPMSISRASRQLEEMRLITIQKRGVQKVLISNETPQNLFNTAKSFLNNPVKRIIYVDKKEIQEQLLKSGESALAEYSMLNPSELECYASGSISRWEKYSTKELQSSENQCAVELWRYDPKILSKGDCVDRLSLALSLQENHDERVEAVTEDILNELWRDISDKRD